MRRAFLDSIYSQGMLLKDITWILGGDFNMITSLQDKKGGLRKLEEKSEAFKETIDKLRLIDIQTNNGMQT